MTLKNQAVFTKQCVPVISLTQKMTFEQLNNQAVFTKQCVKVISFTQKMTFKWR